MKRIIILSLTLSFILGCNRYLKTTNQNGAIGKFNINTDLLLVHYDCKTDVDDLHAIAAFASLIRLPQFSKLNYHAVAGSYGIQEGKYVPPNSLFEIAFNDKWSDAHGNFNKALNEVFSKAINVLEKTEGHIWISEAGQSDFSSHLVAKIKADLPTIDTRQRIHIVQHSNWNEEMTKKENLDYVKLNSDYHKISDGNFANETPCYNSRIPIDWRGILKRDDELIKLWNLATSLANKYNGFESRYNNESINAGGLDFSDFCEVQWIFNVQNVENCTDFLKYIQSNQN